MIFINMKGSHGLETLDEIDRKEFANHKAYKDYTKKLLQEYRSVYRNTNYLIYLSQRATKEWRAK